MRYHRPRRGYVLLFVLAFLLVFLGLLGVACRQTAGALRVEAVRKQQAVRDQGSVHALARGMALLETGRPPSNPYVCGLSIDTPLGVRAYKVTFTSSGNDSWTVSVALATDGDDPTPMPSIFLP